MKPFHTILISVLFCFGAPVNALTLAGVSVNEQVQPQGIQQALVLNGAGIRKKFFVKVYVAGLYVPARTQDAQSIINAGAPSRVLMHFVYSEVSKAKLDAAWDDGFEDNLDTAALQALKPRLAQFKSLFRTLVEGDEVWLDYLPNQGTRVSINGEVQGLVPGADFNAALLSVWLGEEPVTSSLKKGLLGADS